MSDSQSQALPQKFYTPPSTLVSDNHPCLCCPVGKYHTGRYMVGLAKTTLVKAEAGAPIPSALMIADREGNAVQIITHMFVNEEAFKGLVSILQLIVRFLNRE